VRAGTAAAAAAAAAVCCCCCCGRVPLRTDGRNDERATHTTHRNTHTERTTIPHTHRKEQKKTMRETATENEAGRHARRLNRNTTAAVVVVRLRLRPCARQPHAADNDLVQLAHVSKEPKKLFDGVQEH
jgi:hypothetical protein